MITQTISKVQSIDLKTRITEHIKELAEATDIARMSEAMHEYLDMCGKFHQYSPHNVWLILLACPYATQVAGFKKWRTMNRFVRKGERGIPILAPILVKVDSDDIQEEKKLLVGFKVVYVFDISQTDGEPIPEPPNWKSPEQNAVLQERLIRYAEQQGITVKVKMLAGDTQGMSTGGTIVLDPGAGTKTLIHEIAHELMHKNGHVSLQRSVKELEAESVAYVVARHFGLEGLASPNYMALHGADAEMIRAHMERIRGYRS